MDKPIIDLEELLDEAKDRIEEKLIIEGEIENVWQYKNRYRLVGFIQILSLYDLSEKLLTQTKTTIAVAMSNSARITEAFHISK